jgi:hypothetical protein
MTTELEMMATPSQKLEHTTVEGCADARLGEARYEADEALSHVEQLEEGLESYNNIHRPELDETRQHRVRGNVELEKEA